MLYGYSERAGAGGAKRGLAAALHIHIIIIILFNHIHVIIIILFNHMHVIYHE
jgi:hypothetical protein